MNEKSLKYFFDALSAARAIRKFANEKTYDDYCADDLLSSGIERKFEIIGEALNRIKRAFPDDLNKISEWPAIIGFRNVLAHCYDHVEDSVVWGIVKNQIPEFIRELESLPGIEGEQTDGDNEDKCTEI